MSSLSLICTAETHFSCAHFYEQKAWTTERNQQEFGKCFSKYGHGHNYRLQVSAVCELAKMAEVRTTLRTQLQVIREELDHKHLNFDVGYFGQHIPTCENIAGYLQLRFKQLRLSWSEIRLYETPEIFVRVLVA